MTIEVVEDASYSEYLARVEAQRQRDSDRFTGVNQHPDAPVYSADDGKLLHRKQARLVISLDDDGLPVIEECYAMSLKELRSLELAASDLYFAYSIRRWRVRGEEHPRDAPRNAALQRREMEEKRKREQEAWNDAHPFACETCRGRYATERGLVMHRRKSHA